MPPLQKPPTSPGRIEAEGRTGAGRGVRGALGVSGVHSWLQCDSQQEVFGFGEHMIWVFN